MFLTLFLCRLFPLYAITFRSHVNEMYNFCNISTIFVKSVSINKSQNTAAVIPKASPTITNKLYYIESISITENTQSPIRYVFCTNVFVSHFVCLLFERIQWKEHIEFIRISHSQSMLPSVQSFISLSCSI